MFALHDLAALIAVADNGAVRRAAVALGRTQPAVTQAIQRLEEAAGFALLDRSAYRAKFTQRGETFVKRARATVQQARDLGALAAALSRGVEARLRIGVHGAIPIESWMHLIKDVPERFPHTVLEVQTGEGDAPIRRLLNDEAEFAVALGSVPERHAVKISSTSLGEVEFVNVVHASRYVSSSDNDLASLPQIIVGDFDDPDTAYGVVEGHRYWRVSEHRTKVAIILAGAGWGAVPAFMVDAAMQAGTLSCISYRGIGPRSRPPLYLHRKRDKPQGPVGEFIQNRSQAPR
jgi:DNA-binding transcriptional LysR family regulator